MSIINTISAMQSIVMANNAAFGFMSAANARMGLAHNAGNISFGSLNQLKTIDTNLELDMISNSFQYKMAKAMLEQAQKQQKEDAKHLNIFA